MVGFLMGLTTADPKAFFEKSCTGHLVILIGLVSKIGDESTPSPTLEQREEAKRTADELLAKLGVRR